MNVVTPYYTASHLQVSLFSSVSFLPPLTCLLLWILLLFLPQYLGIVVIVLETVWDPFPDRSLDPEWATRRNSVDWYWTAAVGSTLYN